MTLILRNLIIDCSLYNLPIPSTRSCRPFWTYSGGKAPPRQCLLRPGKQHSSASPRTCVSFSWLEMRRVLTIFQFRYMTSRTSLLTPLRTSMNASLIRKHMPGIEVPTTVPTLATFYITKYMQHGVVNIDFNLQWVGVLCKDPDAK